MTKLAWFEESRKFLVAYSDGIIYQSNTSEYEEPVRTEAHEVCMHFFVEYLPYNVCKTLGHPHRLHCSKYNNWTTYMNEIKMISTEDL